MAKSKNYRLTVQIATGLAWVIAAYAMKPKVRSRSDQVVLITGGSRGLGFALAERYARSGARLILTARNSDELVEARNRLNEPVLSFDVFNHRYFEHSCERFAKKGGECRG